MVALALSCARKHELPGEISLIDCEVTPASLEFGAVFVGVGEEKAFTVRNGGADTLAGTISESCAEFAIVGNATYRLAPGAAGTFRLRFEPSAPGRRSCTLEIGADCAQLAVGGDGQAISAGCNVSPATLDFGSVTVGESADRSFTITNGGGATLSGAVSESCAEFSIVGSTSYNLSPGGSQTFVVRFSPASGGAKGCTIETGSTCTDVTASGTGAAPSAPACQVSVSSLAFGTVNVGESADRSFTITNSGGGTLAGSVSESCAEFSIVGSASYNLSAGASKTFVVRFSPTSGGVKGCTIETGAACADVIAGGTGAAPSAPACEVSVTALDFGGVAIGSSEDRTFTVTNTGGGRLTGTVSEACLDFDIVGSGAYDLGGGASATFTVRFTPLGLGVRNCTIQTGGSCANVSASGTGESPAANCQLSTTMHQFGTVTLGNTAEGELLVANVGGGTLSGTLTESCPEFSIVGNPAYSLGALQTARFTIQFAPSAAVAYECVLNAGSTCGTVTLRGAGGMQPSCQLSATVVDFGTVPVGDRADASVDIRNAGSGQLCGTASASCPSLEIRGGASYCATAATPYRLRLRWTPTAPGRLECVVNPGAGCPGITVRGTAVDGG